MVQILDSRESVGGGRNNKDSGNFIDIEENLQHDAIPSVDDSGWFTSDPNPAPGGTKTPNKGMESIGEDGQDSQSATLKVHHMRVLTSSTEVKSA